MDIEPQETHSSIRRTLESEIQELKDELLYLGSMVEKQILGSVDGLRKRDLEAAQKIIDTIRN